MKKNLSILLIGKYSNIVAVLLILLSFSKAYSQQTIPKLGVTVKLKIKDGDLKNSLVTITRKNEPFKILDPGKGENTVDLPLGYEYTFAFTKLGYVTQNVIIDTHVPENRERGEFRKQVFSVELGKERDKDVQYNIKLAYNMDIGDFDYLKGKAAKNEKVQKKETLTTNHKIKPDTTSLQNKNTANNPKKTGSKIKDKKVIQEDTRKFTIITITIDDEDYIYKKEEYDWGGVFFYKNGVAITENTFNSETEE